MLVKEIMTRKVVSIREEDTVEEAAKILSEEGFSGIPVVDENRVLVGIVTEGDLIRRASRINGPSYLEVLGGIIPLESKKSFIEHVQRSMGYLVKDIMTKDVITANKEDTIESVATIMVKKRVKRLPVVDSEDKLIGIISRRDVMNSIYNE